MTPRVAMDVTHSSKAKALAKMVVRKTALRRIKVLNEKKTPQLDSIQEIATV